MRGKQILHYHVLDKVGSGGMGIVYRAHDTRLDRQVALKFLPPELTQDNTAQRTLFAEARAAAQLDHPNIGTVHALEEAQDGQLFIVMAYYEGKTLERRIIPLPEQEGLGYAIQIARGLAHAHETGVVHRDIKPANIICTAQGLIKVLDFGLSSLKRADHIVRAGMTLGTMEYASPEQIRGDPADHRADLWALGVMLYEMLTGVSPFRGPGNAASSSLRVMTFEPHPPSTLNPRLSPELDTLLARLLNKNPVGRFESAVEVAKVLTALQTSPPNVPVPALLQTEAKPTSELANASTVFELPSVPHNLLEPGTPLVGRQDELALLDTYLADLSCRAITLLGLGGAGKTRVALAAAWAETKRNRFIDGVYFVALADVSHPERVAFAIVDALGLNLRGTTDPLEQVSHFVNQKNLLVILDNYEHLTAAATVIPTLLQNCPNLKLIISSRTRLNLQEEWIIPLQGLPFPQQGVKSVSELEQYGAVQLFTDRAKRVDPGFELTPENAVHVARLCRLLAGLPLGLELAAVWVRFMPCADIADEIDRNLDFLMTPARGTATRHQSMRAVFEHSWTLLPPTQQATLRALAGFSGSFAREAAQKITGASADVLAQLFDTSLLQMPTPGRFALHPLIGQYAAEKANQHPHEMQQFRAQHRTYYLTLLERCGEKVRGSEQHTALSTIESELPNILSAWRQALSQADEESLTRTVEPLRVFFDQRGRITEGIALFAHAEALLSETVNVSLAIAGDVWVNYAYLLLRAGRSKEAKPLVQRCLDMLQPESQGRSLVLAHNVLGEIAKSEGLYQEAKTHLVIALDLAQSLNDPSAVAVSLGNLASVEEWLGNYVEASSAYRQSLALARKLEDAAQVALTLNNLSALLLNTEGPQSALPLLEEGMNLAQEYKMHRLLPFFWANLGQAHFFLKNTAQAELNYREALKAVTQDGESWSAAWLLAELGRVATYKGDIPEAEIQLARSLETAWGIQNIPLTLHALLCRAELYIKERQDSKAKRLLTLCLEHDSAEQEDKDKARTLLDGLQERLPNTMHHEEKLDLNTIVDELLFEDL